MDPIRHQLAERQAYETERKRAWNAGEPPMPPLPPFEQQSLHDMGLEVTSGMLWLLKWWFYGTVLFAGVFSRSEFGLAAALGVLCVSAYIREAWHKL